MQENASLDGKKSALIQPRTERPKVGFQNADLFASVIVFSSDMKGLSRFIFREKL